MPIEPGDSDRAGELAARSAEVRRKLTLTDIEQQVGDLRTVEDAMRWLKLAFLWSAAEKIAGSRALAMVGAIREWQKCYDSALARDRVKALERRIAELEGESAEPGRL
jgi:hypothetical protein